VETSALRRGGMRDALKLCWAAEMSGPVERYFVVPHTHWDREWYRPFEHFRLALGGVVDEVLDTLERDPEFRSFTLDGQSIVLEDYVCVRPQNEPRLRKLIAEGRIEIGPSYVLPDEFLVGGESLVRNLLIGRAVCERFGGQPSPAGYLPDSFGHPLQLPQILAGFGIRSFLFSRGLGDEVDELGIAFNWVAPDGSTVLALQLLADYSNFANILGADDAETRVRALLERFGRLLERADIHAVVLCNGTDHRRIQPELPALSAELERRFPGSAFAIARYGDYVSALQTGELPSWSGELVGSRLWNVLRGVNSARLYIKQANERAEQRLLSVETLAGLCALRTGGPFPLEDFTFAWRELLKCHPHDSICGCSCDEVHRDMLVRYASLHRTLDVLSTRALGEFAGRDSRGWIGLVNTLPFARRGVLRLQGAEPIRVDLAGFEARTVELVPAAAEAPRNGNRIVSDRFRVQVARDGTLAIDDLKGGRRFDGLHAIEDELDMGDLYNFCPVPEASVWRCSDVSSRILSDGPLCWELEVSYHGEQPAGLDDELRPRPQTVALSLTTVVRLARGSDRIEFETTIDNAAKDHRLRVVFPVGDAPGSVRAEGQFAVVHRPVIAPQPRTQWCEPPDATQHAGGAVALGSIALITRGLPEYEARAGTAGFELCLTMLRCVGVISRASGVISTRPLGAGPQLATPEGQCSGRHVLEYALRFDADVLDDVALLRASQDYRRPFLLVAPGAQFEPPLRIEGDVVFSCLKGAEDSEALVLRVFNPGSRATTARVLGPVTVERVPLDESGGSPIASGLVEVGPGEITTLRLRTIPAERPASWNADVAGPVQ
jgi:2-O-(6-phospho-alpha-D-mannosyl)-D-glycerate hydrolase